MTLHAWLNAVLLFVLAFVATATCIMLAGMR